MTMLFLEIRRAACAAAAASALFVVNGSVAACEDEYYPAVPTDELQQGSYATEVPGGQVGDPAGPDVPMEVGVTVPDAQIAAIMQAANLGEIIQSRLALTRSAHPAVLAFAQRMIDHHTHLQTQQTELLALLGGVPLENLISLSLTATSALQMAMLLPLSGPGFDLAYMTAQVVDHKMVLDIMDGVLISAAVDPRVRELLSSARPIIADHLAEASSIRVSLLAAR
jgi:putative membrane protein